MEIELQACLEGVSSADPGRGEAEAGVTGRVGDATQDVVVDPDSGRVEAAAWAVVGTGVVPVTALTSSSVAARLAAAPAQAAEPAATSTRAAEPAAMPVPERGIKTPVPTSSFESTAIEAHAASVEVEVPSVHVLAEDVETRASEPSIEPTEFVTHVGAGSEVVRDGSLAVVAHFLHPQGLNRTSL